MAELCRPAWHGVSSPAWFAVVLGYVVLGGGHFSGQLCALRHPITLPLVSPMARVEKKLQPGEKRSTPAKTAPAPPQQVCGSSDLGPRALRRVCRYPGCAGLGTRGSAPAFTPVPTLSAGGLQGRESLCNSPSGACVL